MACAARFGFWIALALSIVLVACGGKGGNGDEDGEADGDEDVPGDLVEEGDDDAVADALEEGEDDVVVDGSEDVVEEDGPDPCTSPGLHTDTVVLVADPGGEIGAANGRGARLAYGGGVIGLGWSDGREEELGVTNEEVYFQILERDGTLVGSEVQVSDAALESRPPAVVWAGDRFVTIWGDSRAMPAGNLFLGGVDTSGSLAGTEAQVTTDGISAMFVGAAWSGSHAGTAWTDNKDGTMDIYFARVGTDGAIDGSITRVQNAAGNSFNASVAWSGSSYYVVWADTAGGAVWEFRIYLAIIDGSSSVTSGPTMISPSDVDAKMPTAAWSDGTLAVCWEDFTGGHVISCAAFDASGTETVSRVTVSSTAGSEPSAIMSPSLTALPSGFGLAWADENGSPHDDEVYFARLSTSLAVELGDTPLTDTTGEMTSVSLAWTGGSGYGVAWVADNESTAGEDTLYYMPFLYCD